MAERCDSVWLDFTKGLGAPLGAVLCGTAAFIDEAWRWKQRLGGSLRQAGICAAACTYALEHNIDRLAEDHANARALARGLAELPELVVEEPETNLVFFDTLGAGLTADELAERIRWTVFRSPPSANIGYEPAPISTWTAPASIWRSRSSAKKLSADPSFAFIGR